MTFFWVVSECSRACFVDLVLDDGRADLTVQGGGSGDTAGNRGTLTRFGAREVASIERRLLAAPLLWRYPGSGLDTTRVS